MGTAMLVSSRPMGSTPILFSWGAAPWGNFSAMEIPTSFLIQRDVTRRPPRATSHILISLLGCGSGKPGIRKDAWTIYFFSSPVAS